LDLPRRLRWAKPRFVNASAQAAATLLAIAAAGGCHATDKAFCANQGCDWTGTEWARVQTLSPLPAPPLDLSNAHAGDPAAVALGQAFYFDTRFSGTATVVDSLERPVAAARAPKGAPINVSCATCHDPQRAGTDDTSVPRTVSVGAGIYDVNGEQTANAAFYPLLYWNGRSDSLWSQAVAVNESSFSMNSSRLQDFWVVVNVYADRYNQVFPEAPLPVAPTTAQFPPNGKPGSVAGCQAGSPTEPFGDAFDCMTADDQQVVDQVFANWGKAIAAYESTLVSANSAFDRFVKDGPGSGWISAAAEHGARLFVGKASCIDCHNTPLLSDGRFHDIAVPQAGNYVPTMDDCPPGSPVCDCTPGDESRTCEPSGAWAGALRLTAASAKTFRRDGPYSDAPGDGPGPGGEPCATTTIAAAPADCSAGPDPALKGAWRTPSLRDVALTAPYMHDGYYPTLADVVQHYNRGGVPGAGTSFTSADAGANGPHVAVQLKPLDLTDQEAADLVAFLETLTGAALPSEQTSAPPVDAGAPAVDARAPADANLDGQADAQVAPSPGP